MARPRTETKARVLDAVTRNPGSTAPELRRACKLHTATLIGLLRELVQDGLVCTDLAYRQTTYRRTNTTCRTGTRGRAA